MSRPLKRAALVLGSVLVLLLLAAAAVVAVGGSRIAATHDVAVGDLEVPADSAARARGAHLAGVYCADCHGDDFAGKVMGDAPPFRLVASNLTPGGETAAYDAADWDRAVRHGVRPDGTALFVMPSKAFNKMADDELAALVAYLQSLPPVGNELARVEWKPLGRALAAGPIDLAATVARGTPPAAAPAPDSSVAYGRYLADMLCAYCHGEQFEGIVPPGGEVPSPDLRASAGWTAEQFHAALTTGVTPSGHEMDPAVMPWTMTARMTPTEREAMRLYLRQLDPVRRPDA